MRENASAPKLTEFTEKAWSSFSSSDRLKRRNHDDGACSPSFVQMVVWFSVTVSLAWLSVRGVTVA